MLKQEALDEVRVLLEPHDFFSGAHRIVYEAICSLVKAGESVDVVTVAHALRNSGRLQQVGGTPFLHAITDATPSVANIGDHAKIVRRLARLRRAAAVLHDLTAEARRAETRDNIDGFLDKCEKEIFAIGTDAADTEAASFVGEVLAGNMADLDPSKPRSPRGCSTGFWDLDDIAHGFVPGDLWYLAARPGIGKTALALGMARAVACTGRHAVFFSQEMKRPQLGERLLSSVSGVAHELITKQKLSAAHYERLSQAAIEMARTPFILDETSALTPMRMRSRLRRHVAQLRLRHPGARLSLVVVDYVQLMGDDSLEGNRNEQLERISRQLKLLAGEFDTTIVALSQFRKPDRATQHQRPTVGEMRGSGAFEQDADVVVLIHRDRDEEEGRGDAELIVAKNRHGKTGTIRVIWEPWCVRYMNRDQAGLPWQGGYPYDDGPESVRA